MSTEKFYDDPTNRIVCIFDDRSDSVSAKSALIEFGYADGHVRLYDEQAASEVDTSAKWFADTDTEIKKFEQQLRSGAIVMSVPIKDKNLSRGSSQDFEKRTMHAMLLTSANG